MVIGPLEILLLGPVAVVAIVAATIAFSRRDPRPAQRTWQPQPPAAPTTPGHAPTPPGAPPSAQGYGDPYGQPTQHHRHAYGPYGQQYAPSPPYGHERPPGRQQPLA